MPLREIIQILGGWPVLLSNWTEKSFDWKNFTYLSRKLGFTANYFLSFHIDADRRNSSKRIIDVSKNQEIATPMLSVENYHSIRIIIRIII